MRHELKMGDVVAVRCVVRRTDPVVVEARGGIGDKLTTMTVLKPEDVTLLERPPE